MISTWTDLQQLVGPRSLKIEDCHRSGRATACNSQDLEISEVGPAAAAWPSELSTEVLSQRGHRCESSETRSQRSRCIRLHVGIDLSHGGWTHLPRFAFAIDADGSTRYSGPETELNSRWAIDTCPK